MRAFTRAAVRPAFLLAAAALAGVLGCGPGGPRVHRVDGHVEVDGLEPSHLAGAYVEAALEGEPTVRASGEVQADGTFTLETLDEGRILHGAREGTYQARLILPDDDPDSRRRAAQALAPRFLQFETSGLTIEVPAAGPVVLRVGPR